jgi:hypothetical protein
MEEVKIVINTTGFKYQGKVLHETNDSISIFDDRTQARIDFSKVGITIFRGAQ